MRFLIHQRNQSFPVRSTVAEINISALHNNIHVLRSKAPNSALMAMVKANAYGHGMVDCSREIENDVDFFGVAVMYEGVTLRLAKITKPIVVMMPPDIYDAEKFCECDLQMVACSLDLLRDFNQEAIKQNVILKAHLYIDTGMRRDGIEPHEAVGFMDACKEFTNISIIGVCTHFATADDVNKAFAQEQLEKFNGAVQALHNAGYTFQYIHAANSGAVFHHPDAHFNMIRPGLSLYGIAPANTINTGLQPVLSLKTRINALRRIQPGESVSYGRRFIAAQATTIATIPIGYGDGYSRLLTGKGMCLLHGKRFQIVGTICMDECMIDVGNEPVDLGDDVVLIGTQGNATISVNEIADTIGTIPYDITTLITARVPRVLVGKT
ncbi:MAG: alanine racemase [Candidatus Kapaibacterium sp.]|nr:alanine racemase [Bacteroidota bacterium]